VDFGSVSKLRRLIVPPYLPFYEYEIEGGAVTVVRIVHGARDLPAVLAGRGDEET